jgi:hypothetical protein
LHPTPRRSRTTWLVAVHFGVLLPNADEAVIDPEKLRDYLLSTEHPHGRFKARVFGALGFRADRWQELESALRTQHLTQDADRVAAVVEDRSSRFTLFWSDPAASPPLS